MIVLGAADTLRAGAADANVVTYTVYGRTRTSTADAYDVLAQGQLSGSTATIYTAPGSTEVLISSIHWCNSSAATTTTFNVFINGTAASNQIAKSLSIAPGVTIVCDSGGWHKFPEATSSGGGDITTDAAWVAKGDLIAGTGSATAAILTVGANDTILMADSAQATGLKWVASASPSAVGTANSTGTADTFTRGDHVHAHETGHVAHDTIWDAAGDVIYGTGADAGARLAIGTASEFLTVNGGATAPQWSTVTATMPARIDLPIGAAALPDNSTNNAAPSIFRTIGTASAPNKFYLTAGFNKDTDQHLWWTFIWPQNYSSGATIRIHWNANATTNSCVWGAKMGAVTPSDADTPIEHAMATAATTTTATNATEAYRLNVTTIDLSGVADSVAAGDLVFVLIYRDADNASDNLAVDANLISAALEYTATVTLALS